MKFTLMFKTPDVIDQIVPYWYEEQIQEIKNYLKQWVKYGELIRIEFDTNEKDAPKVRKV